MATEQKVFDWDDMITTDGAEMEETVVLPEGNYPFEVVKMEKAFYNGSEKIPACNMAKMYLKIDGGELGKGFTSENIYLCEKFEWKASNFLRALGLKKHGEDIKWSQLQHCDGESGRCHVYVDTYTSGGQEKQSNKIDKYFDKEEAAPKKAYQKGVF